MKLSTIVTIAVGVGVVCAGIYLYKRWRENKNKERYEEQAKHVENAKRVEQAKHIEQAQRVEQIRTHTEQIKRVSVASVSCSPCVRSDVEPNTFVKQCVTSEGKTEQVVCGKCEQLQNGAWTCSS